MTISKLSTSPGPAGMNESRKKINEIIDDAGGDFTGGGGSSTFQHLTDTGITSPADGDLVAYNSTSNKWENIASGGTLSKYTSAFTAVSSASTLTITHNLGSLHPLVEAYVSSASSGSNSQSCFGGAWRYGGMDLGCMITSTLTNSFVLQLGQDGYLDWNSSGYSAAPVSFNSKFLRVVVIG